MSIDRTTLRRGLLDIGIDTDETGVDEGVLLSRVNAALSELGMVAPGRDVIRSTIQRELRDLLTEQRQPAAASVRERFRSEVADGIDETSLLEHATAERLLEMEGAAITAETYVDAVERVRAARS